MLWKKLCPQRSVSFSSVCIKTHQHEISWWSKVFGTNTHMDYVHRDTVDALFFFFLYSYKHSKTRNSYTDVNRKTWQKEPQSYSPGLLCYVWSYYTFKHGMITEAHFSNPKNKIFQTSMQKVCGEGACKKASPSLQWEEGIVHPPLIELHHVAVHFRVVVPNVPFRAAIGNRPKAERGWEVIWFLELKRQKKEHFSQSFRLKQSSGWENIGR